MNVDNTLTLLDEVTTEDLADEHQDWTGLTVRESVETVAAGTGVLVVPMSVARLHHRKDVTFRTGHRPAVDHDRAGLARRQRRPAGADVHRDRPRPHRAQLARLTGASHRYR